MPLQVLSPVKALVLQCVLLALSSLFSLVLLLCPSCSLIYLISPFRISHSLLIPQTPLRLLFLILKVFHPLSKICMKRLKAGKIKLGALLICVPSS